MSYFLLLFLVQSHAATKPKFHCYTRPGRPVAAYQPPVKCAGGNKMEIVCTYDAGCKPTTQAGEPPTLSEDELNKQAISNELKPSMLICKGKGEITGGVISKVECPSPTKCREDGLYGGVAAGVTSWTDAVTAPQKGGARVTR
jgi:hypothetical protein